MTLILDIELSHYPPFHFEDTVWLPDEGIEASVQGKKNLDLTMLPLLMGQYSKTEAT